VTTVTVLSSGGGFVCNLFEDTVCNSDYKRTTSKGVLISE